MLNLIGIINTNKSKRITKSRTYVFDVQHSERQFELTSVIANNIRHAIRLIHDKCGDDIKIIEVYIEKNQ